MKKFWRSGMIDKKIVREREQEEYINKLNRTILELSKKPPEPEPCRVKYHNGISYRRDNYDEIRSGDNVTLEFGEGQILTAPRESLKDSMHNTYSEWLINRKDYASDIEKMLRAHQDE